MSGSPLSPYWLPSSLNENLNAYRVYSDKCRVRRGAVADPARCGGAIRLRTWVREAILSEANRGSEALVGRIPVSEVP